MNDKKNNLRVGLVMDYENCSVNTQKLELTSILEYGKICTKFVFVLISYRPNCMIHKIKVGTYNHMQDPFNKG